MSAWGAEWDALRTARQTGDDNQQSKDEQTRHTRPDPFALPIFLCCATADAAAAAASARWPLTLRAQEQPPPLPPSHQTTAGPVRANSETIKQLSSPPTPFTQYYDSARPVTTRQAHEPSTHATAEAAASKHYGLTQIPRRRARTKPTPHHRRARSLQPLPTSLDYYLLKPYQTRAAALALLSSANARPAATDCGTRFVLCCSTLLPLRFT